MQRPRLKRVGLDGKLLQAAKYKPSEGASSAAAALGRRRALLAGKDELARMGRKGATAFWAKLSPEERRIEGRRRANQRKKNDRARMAALLGEK